MGPFLSRDGQLLFFNTRNQPGDTTDIHWAERSAPDRYRHLGPLPGDNSDALDGVPSMDREGRFYFVSPRAYDETSSTLWTGRFSRALGRVGPITLLEGDVSRRRPLLLNIDAEIGADGQTLYFTENRWRLFRGGVGSSDLRAAFRGEDGAFRWDPRSENLFAAINSDLLEFAPATSADELTLYFTRVDRGALSRGDPTGFSLMVSIRPIAPRLGEPPAGSRRRAVTWRGAPSPLMDAAFMSTSAWTACSASCGSPAHHAERCGRRIASRRRIVACADLAAQRVGAFRIEESQGVQARG